MIKSAPFLFPTKPTKMNYIMYSRCGHDDPRPPLIGQITIDHWAWKGDKTRRNPFWKLKENILSLLSCKKDKDSVFLFKGKQIIT